MDKPDLNREVVTTKTSTSTSEASVPSPPPEISTVYERIQIQIAAGVDLNFGLCPRPRRFGISSAPIPIIKQTQMLDEHKAMVVIMMYRWG